MTYSRDQDSIYLDVELHAVITGAHAELPHERTSQWPGSADVRPSREPCEDPTHAVLDVGRQLVELAVGQRSYNDPHAEDS